MDEPAGYLKAMAVAMEALASAPPYCLIGALALGAYGRPRATNDVDFLVLADRSVPEPFCSLLAKKGFSVDERWQAANPMAREAVLRLTHQEFPDIPVDLIFAGAALHRTAIARRRSLLLHGIAAWICSPEDLIMLKLHAGRPRDFEDVLGVVKNSHLRLDFNYLWDWADRLGLRSELSYVIEAARS